MSSSGQLASSVPAEAQERYLDREHAELCFIRRVLELACDTSEPLFERLHYLSISSGLLDEYYKIRVAALREKIERAARHEAKRKSGLTPEQELTRVDIAADALMAEQQVCWDDLHRALGREGIAIVAPRDLDRAGKVWAAALFEEQISPKLEPLVIEAGGAFPFIPDDEIMLAVQLATDEGGEPDFGLVFLPRDVLRFAPVPGEAEHFVLLESLVESFLPQIFSGRKIVGQGVCHVLRKGNLEHDDEMSDLLHDVEVAVKRRRFADVIRLKVSQNMSNRLASTIAHGCGLIEDDQLLGEAGDEDIIASEFVALDGLMGLGDAIRLVDHYEGDGFGHLQYKPLEPKWPGDTRDGDLFEIIRKKELLLHFPFDEFAIITKLLTDAAVDERVVSIHQTLYRSGANSPIIGLLKQAAKGGKDVSVVIELEARDDEAANITLARELEAAGVHVVFGFFDMKVHVKVFMITRREQDGLRTYVNYSTGNYHVGNAHRYTDLSYLTTDDALTGDAAALFGYLMGGERPEKYSKLSVAPHSLRTTILSDIEKEIESARAGKPAAIWGKLNKLTDKTLIDALYEASTAGVEVKLIVRGACMLRPGVVGLSDNIEVRSIVGRFLEHSRLVCFGNGDGLPGGDVSGAKVYLSSADWMPHKLENRVEALVPIDNPSLKSKIVQQVFEVYWRDETNCWKLDPGGTYVRNSVPGGFSAQTYWLSH